MNGPREKNEGRLLLHSIVMALAWIAAIGIAIFAVKALWLWAKWVYLQPW